MVLDDTPKEKKRLTPYRSSGGLPIVRRVSSAPDSPRDPAGRDSRPADSRPAMGGGVSRTSHNRFSVGCGDSAPVAASREGVSRPVLYGGGEASGVGCGFARASVSGGSSAPAGVVVRTAGQSRALLL